MNHRTLGRTGMKVSPLCLGAMMFGEWGNPDHDESIRIIHRALDAGINFIDTADVYSRGESEEIVGKALPAAGATTSCSPRRSTARWATTRTSSATRAAGSCARSRTACAGCSTDYIDLYQIHRPEPDTDIDETLGALTDLVAPGQGALHRQLDVPGVADRRGAVGRRAPRPRALRVRAAAVLDPRARHRGRRAADVPALRHGRDPVEPARRRLAVGQVAQGRRAADSSRAPSGCPQRYDLSIPATSASSRPPTRSAQLADEAGHPADPPGAGVRDPPPGGHVGDHRAAHDGAARVAARPRPTSRCPTTCSTASTRSCRPGTNVNPGDAGWQNPALEPAARRRSVTAERRHPPAPRWRGPARPSRRPVLGQEGRRRLVDPEGRVRGRRRRARGARCASSRRSSAARSPAGTELVELGDGQAEERQAHHRVGGRGRSRRGGAPATRSRWSGRRAPGGGRRSPRSTARAGSRSRRRGRSSTRPRPSSWYGSPHLDLAGQPPPLDGISPMVRRAPRWDRTHHHERRNPPRTRPPYKRSNRRVAAVA